MPKEGVREPVGRVARRVSQKQGERESVEEAICPGYAVYSSTLFEVIDATGVGMSPLDVLLRDQVGAIAFAVIAIGVGAAAFLNWAEEAWGKRLAERLKWQFVALAFAILIVMATSAIVAERSGFVGQPLTLVFWGTLGVSLLVSGVVVYLFHLPPKVLDRHAFWAACETARRDPWSARQVEEEIRVLREKYPELVYPLLVEAIQQDSERCRGGTKSTEEYRVVLMSALAETPMPGVIVLLTDQLDVPPTEWRARLILEKLCGGNTKLLIPILSTWRSAGINSDPSSKLCEILEKMDPHWVRSESDPRVVEAYLRYKLSKLASTPCDAEGWLQEIRQDLEEMLAIHVRRLDDSILGAIAELPDPMMLITMVTEYGPTEGDMDRAYGRYTDRVKKRGPDCSVLRAAAAAELRRRALTPR